MTINKFLDKVEECVKLEEGFDFTGIQTGEYSIIEIKEMIITAIEKKIRNLK